ncbi:TMEM175 family protein [Nocardia sp. NPDC059228]|uniref:TMEM175 family protein n=1 Tax=Nocardia sp. NPDC059228 TaxID=3346777 RepID=UPI0036B005E6
MTEPVGEPRRSTPFGAERDPARLVLFSDAVIAIAVTLLVLEIRVPPGAQDLLHGLITLWQSYLAYVVTFMLIGQIWVNHHVMFDQIRRVDRVVLFLNTVLLMDIAFLPFAAAVWPTPSMKGTGSALPSCSTALRSSWQPFCSMRSGSTRVETTGCWSQPSILLERGRSAGDFVSPWPGSAAEPCWVSCFLFSASP